jgi:hypothetical protein
MLGKICTVHQTRQQQKIDSRFVWAINQYTTIGQAHPTPDLGVVTELRMGNWVDQLLTVNILIMTLFGFCNSVEI